MMPKPTRRLLQSLILVGTFLLPASVASGDVILSGPFIVPGVVIVGDVPAVHIRAIGCGPFETSYTLDHRTFSVSVTGSEGVCQPATEDLVIPLEAVRFSSYDVEINNDFVLPLAVASRHPLRPELYADPAQPTDNDRVRLVMPWEVSCFYFPDRPVMERNGRVIDLMWSGSYGSCVIPADQIGAYTFDLGQLEEGLYRVNLYFQEPPVQGVVEPFRKIRSFRFDVSDGPDVVALRDGRFEVSVTWNDFQNRQGEGRPVADPTGESALFTFFSRSNWELMVKVLDGCALNDRFWVFTAGATNVEYTVTVVDVESGERWISTNPLGERAAAVADTEAFATCPDGG